MLVAALAIVCVADGLWAAPEQDAGAPSRHWSYQPITDPTPPNVAADDPTVTDLDRFVIARLRAAGLSPSGPADRRTLIRRATYDLTGLPPTRAEVEAFLNDTSPGAFARVVDRLLASPRYGERWGRHWLDVARYADSNGLDENVAHGNAWRYRDYVIATFNRDIPFNQFVLEQLAGDLLPEDETNPSQRERWLIATGFLSLGPKVLAEVDEGKMEMDIVDEQVDTVGRAFLATTLGCARCHDHMFDPITMRDYYALAGIFKSTRTMEHFRKIARWWENSIPTAAESQKQAAHHKQLADLDSQIKTLVETANAKLLQGLGPDAKLPDKPESKYDADTQKRLKELRDAHAKLKKTPPTVSTAMGVSEGKPADLAIHLRGDHLRLGDVVPRGVPQVWAQRNGVTIEPQSSGRLELARWLVSGDHPLTARVMVNRVWRWHFGVGLVRTTDNFGRLGEQPSHPLLLDWLASRFVEDGWSIKDLHRRIMLSRTYQMSSAHRADAAAADPSNRLMWRAPVRRLEAEAIRDAALAVSGRLDLTMGGPAVLHVKNREFLFDHTSKDETNYDSLRRSVYLPVIRNNLHDGLALNDFPDSAVPNGNRATTTVAPQALLAMNGDVAWTSAGALAQRLLKMQGNDAKRVAWLYETLFARPPATLEIKVGTQFVERFTKRLTSGQDKPESPERLAWQAYCQALLASNEFIYLR